MRDLGPSWLGLSGLEKWRCLERLRAGEDQPGHQERSREQEPGVRQEGVPA